MSPRITVAGIGAVSSAGWGVEALWNAVRSGEVLPAEILPHPSGDPRLARAARRVPKPDPRPAFLAHPRLRRASVISHFAAAAALEAMGAEGLERLKTDPEAGSRTGIICSLLNGSVNYSARFHGEVLKDPGTASPMLFPETVFNAPASHVATLLGITAPVTTVLGDTAQFFPAVEMAVQWLLDGVVDRCLIIGAEEADWLTAEALALLAPGTVLSEGAGALLLEKNGPGPLLAAVYGPVTIQTSRAAAAASLFREFASRDSGFASSGGPSGNIPRAQDALLVTDLCGDPATDAATAAAIATSWPVAAAAVQPPLHPRIILGESLGAAAALQAVLAVRALSPSEISPGSPDSGVKLRPARAIAAATGGNMQAAALEITSY